MRLQWLLLSAAVLVLAAVEGCAWPDPYVYRLREFDRSLADFGKDPQDRDSVGICYNKENTTPGQITEMAKAECAKYGKVARYSHQRRLDCPLTTPMEAVYFCDVPQAYSQQPALQPFSR